MFSVSMPFYVNIQVIRRMVLENVCAHYSTLDLVMEASVGGQPAASLYSVCMPSVTQLLSCHHHSRPQATPILFA